MRAPPSLSFARCPHRRAFARTALAAWLGCALVAAQADQTVVVTGSVMQRSLEEAPYAISVVERDALRSAGPMLSLSESMARVPGLVVNNRWNYAQDQQISARGFGARAGFGVRGVRLYSDGIPASGPDGQGQVSHFDLAGAQRVEVLRGPFSVLYGNSSGGVISLISMPPRSAEVEAGLDAGGFGLRQGRVTAAAPLGGGFDVRAGASKMRVDGFRPHSAAERDLANLRLGWQGERDTVTVLLNHLDQPAQDPLGLSREQFDTDPLQTTAEALLYDTRKNTRQTQGGASWRHRFDTGALREVQLAVYTGQRGVTQWLSISPVLQQASPRQGGGVIDFDRDFQGAEARLRWAWDGVDVVAGLAADRQRDQRRGFENYRGDTLGVVGELRREETNRASSNDVFVQGEWALGRGLTASAGLRSGRVELQTDDAFLSNGDDAGQRSFRYTNPVLGLRWQAAPGLNLYASAARGHESPTLGELAYRPDGAGGFNDALNAQTSRQMELGARGRAAGWEADFTFFEARTADEIGVATNASGRASFQNVGRTLRRGAELSAGWQPASGWRTRVAATWLAATYRDDFKVCAAVPCFGATRLCRPATALPARSAAAAGPSWPGETPPGVSGAWRRGSWATPSSTTATPTPPAPTAWPRCAGAAASRWAPRARASRRWCASTTCSTTATPAR
jgi:iron complex outermembrane recepter protein